MISSTTVFSSVITMALMLTVLAGLLALVYSVWTMRSILSLSSGNARMQAIATAIQEGANAYLSRQYRSIAVVGFLTLILFSWGFKNHWIAVGFVIGAVLSGISGSVGMMISVRANVRTTEAARKGIVWALSVAFRSGAATGFLVTSFGLLGVALYTWYLMAHQVQQRPMIEGLVALSFGASLISIFARLGGGIFTKGADVGADLVGKIEAGIPEDDPRNPAVIADNVGDNVGDCAGMSADLFETYVVTLVACMQTAFLQFQSMPHHSLGMFLLPLLVSAVCLIACLVGTWAVRLKKSVMGALYKGLLTSMGMSGIGLTVLCLWMGQNDWIVQPMAVAACGWIGIVCTGLLVWITEYYTACEYSPVKGIAQASLTGSGTNVIQGLAVSMEACFLPVLTVGAAIMGAYSFIGLYGIAIAATTMLALMSMIIAIDAYGPVTDNAGGIAEMSQLPPEIREITDQLDAVGNTTKAITKGYSIGSAVLASIVLFAAYTQDAMEYLSHKFAGLTHSLSFDLGNPLVIVGLLLGGAVPYMFGAMSMKAVGKAAGAVVLEVRRQFKEKPEIMTCDLTSSITDARHRPDYGKTVDLLTKASIKAMIIPSLLPLVLPLGVYGIGYIFTRWTTETALFTPVQAVQAGLTMVGGALLGMIITGFFLAVSMTSGGGAWDNAKKFIESGHYGGKGSPAYLAAVTGDTVGDPYKDTAGPAINPLIKIANLAAILLVAWLYHC